MNTILTKKSGMLGLTGFSDLRDIQAEAEKGNTACQLVLDMNAYRIKKMVCTDMDFLGLVLDDEKNETRASALQEINTEASKIKILVIPTNEELEIAKQVYGGEDS